MTSRKKRFELLFVAICIFFFEDFATFLVRTSVRVMFFFLGGPVFGSGASSSRFSKKKNEFASRGCGPQGSVVGVADVLVQATGSVCFRLRLSGNPIERCGSCVW